MKRGSPIWGLILIFIGGLLLYSNAFNVNIFGWHTLWPIFVLGPGLVFEMSYFIGRKAPGLLVPGGILTTIGLLFFFETFTGWRFAAYTWPIYILSVAIGLFQLYLFSGRPKALLIPVSILTAVAMVSLSIIVLNSFMSFIDFGLIIPLALLTLGGYIIYNNLRS
ncbi:MAG: hypothetical protein ACOYWZ_23520 [Bacillota bacterium]